MSFNLYPYQDTHELNTDWIIGKIKNVETAEANTKQYAEDADAAKIAAQDAQTAAEDARDIAVNAKDTAVRAKDDAEDAKDYVVATKNQLDLLEARVDNIIPDGTQTAGNTELLDIRVGADGTIYTSAGDAVRDQIDDLQDQITLTAEILDNDLATPDFTPKTVNISSGAGNAVVSNIFNVTGGTSYYLYMKVKITDLSTWNSGQMFGQLLHGVTAGTTTPILSIANNGEYVLEKVLTPSTSGTVKAIVQFTSQNPATNSFTVTLEKLFVIETDQNLKDRCDASAQSDKLLVKINIPDESITAQMLDPDALTPVTDTSIIDCWGDSLTAGAGSSTVTYPIRLQTLIGGSATVNNYGQGSESAEDIAFRQGALAGIVQPFTVGAVNAYVAVPVMNSIDGQSMATLSYQGTYLGNNIVTIGNTRFLYRYKSVTECYFINLTPASVGTVYSRPQYVKAQGEGTQHINIICIGQNGYGTGDPEELANIIQLMVDHNNSPYYIVVGRPTGNDSTRSAEEHILATRFGDHFVNARKYISAYGLDDNGLTPTSADTAAMAIGAIPPSLLSDSVHMNDYGYTAMGNCIYDRGLALGFWS